MRHTRLWIVASILAILIVADFIFSVPHTKDIPVENAALPTAPTSQPVVSVQDVYRRGVHTISGSITVATPCTEVSAAASLTGTASTTQTILVAITAPEDTGICLQQKTIVPFSTTLSAPAQLPLVVTVNGETASTTSL